VRIPFFSRKIPVKARKDVLLFRFPVTSSRILLV